MDKREADLIADLELPMAHWLLAAGHRLFPIGHRQS
jgi:hypothetical protein